MLSRPLNPLATALAAEYPTALVSPRPVAPVPRDAWWVPCLLLAACALPRIAMAIKLEYICADAATYVRCAKLLEQGDLLNAFGPTGITLFPVVLAGLNRFGIDEEVTGKAWCVAVATLAILPIWGWVRQRYNDRVALAAAFLYIIHPKLIEWSPEVIRDPTFWLLAATTVYAGWRAVAGVSVGWFLLAGVAWTLSLFTRFEGWILAVPLVLWSGWRWWSLETARLRLVVGLAVCLAICPLTFAALQKYWLGDLPASYWGEAHRLSRITRWWDDVHRPNDAPASPAVVAEAAAPAQVVATAPPMPTATTTPALAATAPALTAPPVTAPAPATPAPLVVEAVSTPAPPSFRKSAWLFVHTMRRGLDAAYGLLLLGGIWKWRRMWLRRDNQPLAYVAVGVLAGVWVHLSLARESSSRYALVIVILGIPFAALALLGFCDWVARQAQRFGPRQWAGRGLLYAAGYSGMLLAIGGLGLGDALHGDEPQRRRDAELGRWLAARLGTGHKIATVGGLGLVAHYAGAANVAHHYPSFDPDYLTALGYIQPDLLLIDRSVVKRGQLAALVEAGGHWNAVPLATDGRDAPRRAADVLILARGPIQQAARDAAVPRAASR